MHLNLSKTLSADFSRHSKYQSCLAPVLLVVGPSTLSVFLCRHADLDLIMFCLPS